MKSTSINTIPIQEAIELTGYTKPYLLRIFSEAGLTRFGKSENFLREEIIAYFRYRSKTNSESNHPGENKLLKNERIRTSWRKELDKI